MNPVIEKKINVFIAIIAGLAGILFAGGCDNPETSITANTPAPVVNTAPVPAAETPPVVVEPAVISESQQMQFNIGNKSYLFDVSDHSLEEMEALLVRAKEISLIDSGAYNDLKIVMILHGPDIEWFTSQNREHNGKLISLAEELDNLDIIDMKVCETALNKRGIKREDIPAFIESVPYAPDEIARLLQQDFINL